MQRNGVAGNFIECANNYNTIRAHFNERAQIMIDNIVVRNTAKAEEVVK